MVKIAVPRMRLIHGRWYWRPTPAIKTLGFSAEALGEDLGKAVVRAQKLNALVEAARRESIEGAGQRIAPESMADLVARYRTSPRYEMKAAATKRSYESILTEIETKAGHLMVTDIDRRGLMSTYDKLRPRGLATAAAHMRIWRLLLGHARNLGWITINPAEKLGLVTPPARRQVWTRDQLEAFCAEAERQGRASIALAARLALDIGQRRADVLTLTWSQWDGGAFTIRQQKTGAAVTVPVSPEVRARLEALRATSRGAVQVIVSEATKRPYKADHFAHEVARIRDAAGLPAELQFRDLRRTAATEIGAAGGTDDEIRAVTGHRDRSVVSVYVVPDRRFAENAQRKRQERTGKGSGKK